MKILLLEDDYERVEHFRKRVDELNERNNVKCELVHVETADNCIKELENVQDNPGERFHVILLDHDLGGEIYVDINNKNTGSEVARWINKNPTKTNSAFVITHTFNPAGAKNITGLLPECLYIPAIWMKDKFHKIIQVD
jgi:CheY-like chemotaxis protein